MPTGATLGFATSPFPLAGMRLVRSLQRDFSAGGDGATRSLPAMVWCSRRLRAIHIITAKMMTIVAAPPSAPAAAIGAIASAMPLRTVDAGGSSVIGIVKPVLDAVV